MRVLYVGLLYNYGKEEEGYSYEHHNLEAGFHDCVNKRLFEADFLYPDACENPHKSALEFVIDGNIDAIFHVAFNESLDFPEQAAKLALKKDIPVIQWDCDTSWRFGSWIKQRKDRVSHFVTTHSATLPWYEKCKMNAIKSQWAGSPFYSYRPTSEKLHDISFIGQKHGQHQTPEGLKFVRAEIVDAVMAAGLDIDLFGNYWDGYDNWKGYLREFQKVVNVFNESKVCLNISNPWHFGTMPQIKGRHFEIPQTGQFQLTTPADDLESYFVPDKEIVVARSTEDIIEKSRYYLEHKDERNAIASAGYERMMKDHQWEHRFRDIFGELGLL
jgi:spore maturation protein CgeB